MNNDYMHEKQESVTIRLSPSKREYEIIHYAYYNIHGNDNTYEDDKLYRSLVDKYATVITLKNITLHEAQEYAEPIRIAHPDQCVSLYAGDAFIGNTSWTDQMDMFWEYPVYTEAGEIAQKARRAVAEKKQLIASYE